LSVLLVGPKKNEKKRKYSGNIISEKPEIVREVDMNENSMWSVEKVFIWLIQPV
jgi:hypothetical protein